ncbi:MAG: hypothetical protein SGILL_009250, partial [Bacillariaceae sp.]
IGTDTLYKLLSVGIPVTEIPLTSNKSTKVKNHYQWIKNRKTFEKANVNGVDTSNWFEHPQNHDVLFRKGGHTLRQGNIDFFHLLEPYFQSYFSACVEEKKRIRETIIQDSMAKGCLFLEMDRETGLWMQIQDQETLHKKVTSCIYDHRKRLETRQDMQISNCETISFLGGNKRRKLDGKSNSLCSPSW